MLDNEEEAIRAAKRPKLDSDVQQNNEEGAEKTGVDAARAAQEVFENLLPPSRVLLGEDPLPEGKRIDHGHFGEFDVGISEYISRGLPPVHAIIKQR